MIISQTPFRVSFAGGGTDLPAFYREEPGAVFSVTIQRHMYVTVHRSFDAGIRVAYSRTESARTLEDVQHEIVREGMRLTNWDGGLEITTVADVPGGTGMGSSSSLTVGVLHALHALAGRVTSRDRLAEEACSLELDILGKPIGKQDQYAAAFGGFNHIVFNPDETVSVTPVVVSRELQRSLEERTLLFYTATTRKADGILEKQTAGTASRMATLRRMRDLATDLRDSLISGSLTSFGELLNEGWELKRSLGFGISNPGVDEWYDLARKNGATGGKLLGAGGGGFLLVVAEPDRHDAIRAALGHPTELPFAVDRSGTRIVFVSEQQ